MSSLHSFLSDVRSTVGKRLLTLFPLLVVTGISDGISIALLLPLLELLDIGGAAQGEQGNIQRMLGSGLGALGIELTILSVSAVVAIAFAIQMALFLIQSWYLSVAHKNYVAIWQSRLFKAFIYAKWRFFLDQRSGQLMNAIITEVPRAGSALHAIIQMMVAVLIALVYLVISLSISWRVTLILLVIAAVLFGIVRPIRQKIRLLGTNLGAMNAEFTNTLSEIIGGAKLVKASAAENFSTTLVDDKVDRLRRNLIWSAFLPSIVRAAFELGLVLILLVGLIWGIAFLGTSMAQFLVICALVIRLFPKLLQVQQFYNLFNLNFPAYRLIEDLYDSALRLAEAEHPQTGGTGSGYAKTPLDITVSGIDVVRGDRTVLSNVDIEIPAGKIIGIIGRSGAGKSTLVDCLLGLVTPRRGSIVVGDRSLHELSLLEWRSRVGYVPQDDILFNDTIANNIRWSMPSASDAEVREAADKAGLNDLLDSLPEGYDTFIGDHGTRLSGGQCQRISLARALLRKPILLILDEATSALDTISERGVMDAIASLKGKLSIVIIAHRMSILRRADRLYLLDEGRIRASGTWDQLAKSEPEFMSVEDR